MNDNEIKTQDASLRARRFRTGVFATLTSIFVIVAVIGLNIAVSMLRVKADMTDNNKYSLTNETKAMLNGITDDITIYYLTKEGSTVSWLQTFFDLYKKENKNLKVKTVDMLLNPTFATQYTSENVLQHSLIVVNETNGRSRYVSYQDLLIFEYGYDSNFNITENIVGLDIEGQINSALLYVTTGEERKVYALTGHGETAMGDEVELYLRRSNISTQSISLLSAGSVPDDCDVLYIAMPQTDYTAEEMKAIRDYTAKGGNLFIVCGYQDNMTNFYSLIQDYGATVQNGIVFEGDDNRHYANVPYCIFPNVRTHEITNKLPEGKYIVLPTAFSLKIEKDSAGLLNQTTLLITSDASFLKVPNSDGAVTSMVKEKNDEAGPFCVGVFVKNTGNSSNAVIFAGPTMFPEDFFKVDSYGNADLFGASMGVLTDATEVSSVRKIMFNQEQSLVITASQSKAIGIVFILIIPVMLLTVGIVIMIRRKRR